MRLLQLDSQNNISLTKDLIDKIPPYTILSHTWGDDDDEVTYQDLANGRGQDKKGYKKIIFCGKQTRRDGIVYFWVDTCCIDKTNNNELSEAITSMFRWYHKAVKCYVYLSDVSASPTNTLNQTGSGWELDFRNSRWFTRGWTLQELLAPDIVEFYAQTEQLLGDRKTLVSLIHEITDIPIDALRGTALSLFPPKERMRWAANRKTKKSEDKAYCLLGIFGVFMPLIYGEGDNASTRLEKSIAERYGSIFDTVHKHWLVPRTAQPLFTGRKALLQELESIVRDTVYRPLSAEPCRIVISGIGGQGKSELSLQLARRLRHMFWAVLWIDISTTELAERSFLEIAQTLSLSAQTWQEARSRIANLTHPWLLVLDNADSHDVDYLEYFPDSPIGVVMMTTRNEECQQYSTARIIDLGGLDNDDDACELLLKACRVPRDRHSQHQSDARKVASLLQSHALALLQAGAYIARGHCSLATYPQVYQEQRQQLSKFRPSQARSRYQDVYTTFEVSADVLKKMQTEAAEDALHLISLLAVSGSSRLPISTLFKAAWQGAKQVCIDSEVDSNDNHEEASWLTSWHVVHAPLFTDIDNDVYDPHRLTEAISLLKTFSLLSTDVNDGALSVSVHPIIHAWAWDRQGSAEQQQSWLQLGCLVALALKGGTLTQRQKRQLQAHVEALTEWPITIMFAIALPSSIAPILLMCGRYLQMMRGDVKLYNLLQKAFTGLKLDWAKVERVHVSIYHLAGINLLDHGKVQESVALLEQVVKIKEHSLAEDHPDRLASQHELARAYQGNGQAKEAVALLEQVVRIEEHSLAEDHPDRLASQHVVAIAYQANGQVREAVALLEQVVRIKEHSLAEDHPDRLTSQHELAIAYQANGQVREAVALLEQVVRIKEHSLAEDHPDRLTSQHELAIAYQANGQVREAVALLEQVVRIKEHSLVEDHPDRLASQHELAGAYQANGQVREAVALLEQVVRIQESLAEDHPDRLASQYNLALYLWQSGERERPLAMFREVVSLAIRVFNHDHPHQQIYEGALADAEHEMARLGGSLQTERDIDFTDANASS